MRLLAALLCIATLVPLPSAAAQETWSVDATVHVRTATTADYEWRIAGLASNVNLSLPVPDNATFLEAFEEGGARLSAGTSGDSVWVVSKSKPFTLRFRLEGQRDGPFSIFPAQVASAPDSPVSVGIVAPQGWTLSGFRNNEPDAPRDASGRFHHTGPSYVQWLVLEAGITDPGSDPAVAGPAVLREATAQIGASAVQWSLETTYDTDVYGRGWEVYLPDGATAITASTPVGDATTRREGDILHVTTPYPVGFGLGARSFTVDMQLPAPESYGGAFRQANLSVRAGEDDRVELQVSVADGLRYAGARVAGGVESALAPMRYTASGPLSVSVAVLPPAQAGHVQFTEGMFVVDAPQALANAARATARNASELLPHAAAFVQDTQARPFYVSYTSAPIFGWEQGFYSNGLNTMSIRASTLENATDGTPRLTPVGVLIHEATHGLIDRRMPDAPSDLSFLHEGLARVAESGIETRFDQDQVMDCSGGSLLTQQSCTIHSARPTAEDVQEYHRDGNVFPVGWSADEVPDAERGFLYDYSGLVLSAFAQRAPPGALDNALLTIERTEFTGSPQQDSETLLRILLDNAPGTTEQGLLYPGREAYSLSAGQFHSCMGALVAPPYPWQEDDVRAPPGGCPPTGYGPRNADLPTPPPEPEAEPEPSPVVIVTRAPPLVMSTPPPTPVPPDLTTGARDPLSEDEGDGEAPGAIVQPPGGAPPSAIPGPALALVLALMTAVAVALRRPRRR